MRASVGLLGGAVILFLGITAVSESAQQSHDAAVINGTNSTASAWNMTDQVFTGIGQAASPAIVYGGAAAFVLLALGLAVAVSGGGR